MTTLTIDALLFGVQYAAQAPVRYDLFRLNKLLVFVAGEMTTRFGLQPLTYRIIPEHANHAYGKGADRDPSLSGLEWRINVEIPIAGCQTPFVMWSDVSIDKVTRLFQSARVDYGVWTEDQGGGSVGHAGALGDLLLEHYEGERRDRLV